MLTDGGSRGAARTSLAFAPNHRSPVFAFCEEVVAINAMVFVLVLGCLPSPRRALLLLNEPFCCATYRSTRDQLARVNGRFGCVHCCWPALAMKFFFFLALRRRAAT